MPESHWRKAPEFSPQFIVLKPESALVDIGPANPLSNKALENLPRRPLARHSRPGANYFKSCVIQGHHIPLPAHTKHKSPLWTSARGLRKRPSASVATEQRGPLPRCGGGAEDFGIGPATKRFSTYGKSVFLGTGSPRNSDDNRGGAGGRIRGGAVCVSHFTGRLARLSRLHRPCPVSAIIRHTRAQASRPKRKRSGR
jgi:hypothetical protein